MELSDLRCGWVMVRVSRTCGWHGLCRKSHECVIMSLKPAYCKLCDYYSTSARACCDCPYCVNCGGDTVSTVVLFRGYVALFISSPISNSSINNCSRLCLGQLS